jgi:hypothetical protein
MGGHSDMLNKNAANINKCRAIVVLPLGSDEVLWRYGGTDACRHIARSKHFTVLDVKLTY